MSAVSDARMRWRGIWRNELFSLLRVADVVVLTPAGSRVDHLLIDGSYQSAKGSVPFGQPFPMRGFVTADQITFSVSYRYLRDGEVEDDRHTLATWAGQILPVTGQTAQQLKTLWHLVPDLREGDNEDQYGWVIAWSGEDRFDKLSDDPDFVVPEPPIVA